MSFDRMDNYPAYSGNVPRMPQFISKPGQKREVDSPWFDMAGRAAVPTAAAANHSLLRQWADKAAIWGSEDFASAFVNHATSPNGKAGQAVTTAPEKAAAEQLSKKFGNHTVASGAKPTAVSYSEMFKLDSKHFSPKEFTWSKYKQTVNENLQAAKHSLKTDGAKGFFQGVTPKSYFKNTVIENNIKPFRDVVNNSPDKQVGTAAIRAGAMGLMGFDVLKHTNDAYKMAKAKEDGSIGSKLHTLKETSTAFGKYVVRDGGTWEAAGIGAAIGKAVIPMALGGVSLGGIAAGALVGLAAQRMLDKTLKTGSRDPVQQAKQKEKLRKQTMEKQNPFRVNGLSTKPEKEP